MGDLALRGAVIEIGNGFITPAALAAIDVFWTTDLTIAWTPAELSALGDWFRSGGSLLLEGDNTATVSIFNTLLDTLGAGILYSADDGASATTGNIFPHATTTDVDSILLIGNVAHLSTVIVPAAPLVNDTLNVTNTAYSEVGRGSIGLATREETVLSPGDVAVPVVPAAAVDPD